MKKVFLLAVALLAFCAAKAQPAVGDFTWGAKVGFNATNIAFGRFRRKALQRFVGSIR